MRASARPIRNSLTAAALALGAAMLLLSGPAATQAPERIAPRLVNDEIERFCGNIADAARDRRYLMQRQELEALRGEIDQRVRQLEEKRADYERWMQLRRQFMDKATDNVVGIYATMRPDAAAERLATMPPELAAAIMLKLQVKQSGLIMNEMNTAAAAKLTRIMAAAAREEDPT